ncbi:acyl-CoA dehydrogenase [Psychrosphaera sp. B3R10]|uniref:acyl-CoA dehydrogenase n=1 Tax=unclassified Psychrosphaera TaxID=2641570 RepID=UPI001C0849A4|nr:MULTISPECIES: acyl-CoA dehydrogenase [unclassified Psychrosphaera]MBU2883809.1 acyl-CoA dehydrogenase [Psychrosphaera sp. I2R16]MBU2990202.1 acyl-CoA dehydrogenase [Psychrosphaera sp. B3R10]MDO6720464.1 acyl-CoA dehydrogenase [Psychrosphaera sp. 1_MG-2023]
MSLRQKFKKILPEISRTEQEALDAGDTWIEASIYQGKPDFDTLLQTAPSKLTEEEQAFIDGPLSELLMMLDDMEVHDSIHIPPRVLQFLKDNKFFSFIIPKEYGGLEFSAYASSTIVASISTKSNPIATTVMVPNSLGPGELLAHFGTKEQKDHYLPRLVDGRDIPCFALTSPEAGSDAGGIPDRAIVTKQVVDGEEVIGLSCTWDKRYITLAPIATVLGLAVKVFDPEGLLGGEADLGITCLLLPSDYEGVEIGNRHKPLGVNFYNGTTRGNDVFVPMDFVIGGEKNVGKGWQMLVACLGAGRGVSLPANGCATGHAALKSTSEYAAIREQFGMPIGKFEGIQEQLALIGGLTFNLEAMRHLVLNSLDLGFKPSVITAIAKYHMTEMGRTTLQAAMDTQAGKAIQMGPNNVLATAYFATPIGITVEGANILTRNLMIFGQGATRCHPHVQDLITAIHSEEPDADKQFNKLFKSTIGYSIKNFFRGVGSGYLPGFGKGKNPDKMVNEFETRINRLSAILAVQSDFALLVLGGDLKRKEMLSARLGDMLSYLFMAMGNIKFYTQSDNREALKPYFEYGTTWALQRAEEALTAYSDNFPNRLVANWLSLKLGMPFMSKTKVSDKMITTLSDATLKNDGAKKELTHLVSMKGRDGFSVLTEAYEAKLAVLPLLDKMKQAVRAGKLVKQLTFEELVLAAAEVHVISVDEKDELLQYDVKRKLAIAVDEYTFDMELLTNNGVDEPILKSA